MDISSNVFLLRSSRKYLLVLSVFLILATPGYAQYGNEKSEKVEVCAKYQTQSGWSDSYSVTATVANGSVLNEKTGTLDYDGLSTYAVIFWGDDQATVLKLKSVSGEITAYGTKAIDQRGKTWRVSTSDMCY